MPRRGSRSLGFGELQAELMDIIWRLGGATVDEVRAQQRPPVRSAYTTVQTVLNRLVDRGLLSRERRGKAYVYRARCAQSELLARGIRDQLAQAAPDTRRAALIHLIGELEAGDLDELTRQANRIKRARGKER